MKQLPAVRYRVVLLGNAYVLHSVCRRCEAEKRTAAEQELRRRKKQLTLPGFEATPHRPRARRRRRR